MSFLISFILFVIFYAIFDWIIKKANIDKLFQGGGFTRIISVIIILIATLLSEQAKSFFYEKYGGFSYSDVVTGALLSSIYLNFTPLIFKRSKKLKKDNLKGIAKLIYRDVSDDPWDQANLTKNNLDYTVESIRFMDIYVQKLMNTERGKELLTKHFDHFVLRIGAYIGEVIKVNTKKNFDWYEFDSVYNCSQNHDLQDNEKKWSVLYSKKEDRLILPLKEVSQYLKGQSSYPDLLTFVRKMLLQSS